MAEKDTPEELPQMESFYHYFEFEDMKEIFVGALRGKAEFYSEEAAAESFKGAADRAKIATLKWAADQLQELANIVAAMEDGEMRERPIANVSTPVEPEIELMGPPASDPDKAKK